MGRRFTGLLALAVVATGCATLRDPSGGAGSSVRLEVPANLAWEPEGPFELKFVVFNQTRMMLMMVQPKVEATEVVVYKSDNTVACRTRRADPEAVEGWFVRKVGSLTGMDLRLDLQSDCRNLPSGRYRFELTFLAVQAVNVQDHIWSGSLGPQGGRILVQSGASALKYEELVAALDSVEALPVAAAPATPGVGPAATGDATAVRACVDKELAARGMNAYGDSKGTVYTNGPPTDEYGRVLYVASRSPAIRKACGITGF